ncbi:hypothetical protein F4677DRAFT_445990 [Hypoxylon crocopeplum]|nr:hypothetical protein F4677DRAFT_445990 [Hypoxylon crocopeplum]
MEQKQEYSHSATPINYTTGYSHDQYAPRSPLLDNKLPEYQSTDLPHQLHLPSSPDSADRCSAPILPGGSVDIAQPEKSNETRLLSQSRLFLLPSLRDLDIHPSNPALHLTPATYAKPLSWFAQIREAKNDNRPRAWSLPERYPLSSSTRGYDALEPYPIMRPGEPRESSPVYRPPKLTPSPTIGPTVYKDEEEDDSSSDYEQPLYGTLHNPPQMTLLNSAAPPEVLSAQATRQPDRLRATGIDFILNPRPIRVMNIDSILNKKP